MKHFVLPIILLLILITQTNAQSYKLGDKAYGGIVIEANKKSDIAIRSYELG